MTHISSSTIISFDNDDIWFEVIYRPRIGAVDVWEVRTNRKNRKYVGTYSDVSEWDIKDMLMKMYPELKDEEE